MGATYLIDTNIISKLFDGVLPINALNLMSDLATDKQYISVINRIELLSWKELKGNKLNDVKEFLKEITELELTEPIIDRTIKIKKGISIRLPDAINAATAIVNNLTLLSDNDKDFEKIAGLKYINPTKI